MALPIFQSELKDVLRKLNAKEFSTTEERDQLLDRLKTFDSLEPRDLVWMLFRPDRAYRDAAVEILRKLQSVEIVDLFVAESKSKPDAAFRAATTMLFSLQMTGTHW